MPSMEYFAREMRHLALAIVVAAAVALGTELQAIGPADNFQDTFSAGLAINLARSVLTAVTVTVANYMQKRKPDR